MYQITSPCWYISVFIVYKTMYWTIFKNVINGIHWWTLGSTFTFPWTRQAPISSQSIWNSRHKRHGWSQRMLGRCHNDEMLSVDSTNVSTQGGRQKTQSSMLKPWYFVSANGQHCKRWKAVEASIFCVAYFQSSIEARVSSAKVRFLHLYEYNIYSIHCHLFCFSKF